MVHQVDAPGNDNGEFTNGDGGPTPPTNLEAKWHNMVQRELINLVQAAGITPDDLNDEQVLEAVLDLSGASGVTRNALLNPTFNVNRRGKEFSLPDASKGAEFYTVDRWRSNCGDGTADVTQVANDQSVASNPQVANRALRHDQTATSTTAPSLKQRIWSLSAYSGVRVKVSFQARASKAINVTPRFRQHFGSGGSANADVFTDYNEGAPAAVTTAWQRFEFTFDFASVTGLTVDGGPAYTELIFNLPIADTFWVEFSEVSVETSPFSTQFKNMHRQFGLEVLLTAPYCQTSYTLGGADADLGENANFPGGISQFGAMTAYFNGGSGEFRVPGLYDRVGRMRALPTVTWYSPLTGAAGKVAWFNGVSSPDFDVIRTDFRGRNTTGIPVVLDPPANLGLVQAHYLLEAEI